MIVNRDWCDATSGASFDVIDTATGDVIGFRLDGAPFDVERAVEAAGLVIQPHRRGSNAAHPVIDWAL